MFYNCIISGKFRQSGTEFKNVKYLDLSDFLYSVMGINVLDKEEMKRNMEVMNCSLNEYFDSDEEINLFKENDKLLLLTGFKNDYIVYEDCIDAALLKYIKESENFNKSFSELFINNERII